MNAINKTAIAMAVAGVLAAPLAQADVKVKGLFSTSIDFVDVDTGSPVGTDGTQMNTNQSSIGFKWSEDLGNGNKVIGFIDFSYDPTDLSGVGSRDQYIGFTGDWGKVVFGTTSTGYKSSGAMIDPLWRTAAQARTTLNQMSRLHSSSTGTASGTAATSTSTTPAGRVNDIIRYDSPNMSGFKANIWTSLDDTTADDHNWGGGIHYKNGPLIAFIDYLTWNSVPAGSGSDDDAWKVGAKYDFGQFKIWGHYENDGGAVSLAEGLHTSAAALANAAAAVGAPSALGNTDSADFIYLAGQMDFGGNNFAILSYGQRDDSETAGVSNNDGTDSWDITVGHNMSKRTLAYASYGNINSDTSATTDADTSFLSVGLRHKF